MQLAHRHLSRGFSLLLPLALFCVSIVGVFAVSVYSKYFDSHKIVFPIDFFGVKMDVIGAIVPLIIGIFFAIFYFRSNFPKLTYIACFLLAIAISFVLGQPTNIGLVSNPATFSFFVSLIAIFFTIFFAALKEKSKWKMNINYFTASLVLAISCIPLAKIVVDFYYVSLVVNPVIGGNGLADGVLLSTMYAPLASIMALSVTLFCLRIFYLTSQRKADS